MSQNISGTAKFKSQSGTDTGEFYPGVLTGDVLDVTYFRLKVNSMLSRIVRGIFRALFGISIIVICHELILLHLWNFLSWNSVSVEEAIWPSLSPCAIVNAILRAPICSACGTFMITLFLHWAQFSQNSISVLDAVWLSLSPCTIINPILLPSSLSVAPWWSPFFYIEPMHHNKQRPTHSILHSAQKTHNIVQVTVSISGKMLCCVGINFRSCVSKDCSKCPYSTDIVDILDIDEWSDPFAKTLWTALLWLPNTNGEQMGKKSTPHLWWYSLVGRSYNLY